MTALVLTRDIAFAAGQDAANRQMRASGRKAWSKDDYNLAAKTTNRLLRHVPFEQGGLAGIPEHMLP